MMELGNMIWGNSRGEFEVPREDAWTGPLVELMEQAGCDFYGMPSFDFYGKPGFENGIFIIRPYYWGDCVCGCEEDDHAADCPIILPNFHYLPTDFKLDWYKYPLRDSYMNQDVSIEQFLEIPPACPRSLACR